MASRTNAYKHGLTAKVLIPQVEMKETERRFMEICNETQPSGMVGQSLALRAATLSTRMDRFTRYENAKMSERVRQAEADFVPPEGVDEATAARLRAEACDRALFDDSKEMILARKYDAAAERGFFRALKELQLHEKAVKKEQEKRLGEISGSFLTEGMSDEEFDRLCEEVESMPPRQPGSRVENGPFEALKARVDVPISIGKRR